MMKLKIFVLILIPVLIFGQNAKDQLAELQNKYKAVKSFTADFSQSTKAKSVEKEYKSSGKIYFKKEDKFRVELTDQILVTDGKSVWNHNVKQKKVIISKYDSEPSVLSLDKFILEFPKECDVRFAGEGSSRYILLKPRKSNSEFKEIRIFPDSKSILSKLEFTDANGNFFSFEFSNVKLDENISDKQFNYSVPKGTRTVDLR